MATTYETVDQLKKGLEGILKISDGDVKVLDERNIRSSLIDDLIFTAVFSSQDETGRAARWLIRRSGAALGVLSTSIMPLYEAMGRKEVSGFTVPAINIRALTYDVAQAVFRAAMKKKVGPVIEVENLVRQLRDAWAEMLCKHEAERQQNARGVA